jgi:hypothetical protein
MGLTLPAEREGFKDLHAGETIYVIGSGASLNFIDPAFFADKICVCVNRVGLTLAIDDFYSVTHYHRDAMIVAAEYPSLPIITPWDDLGAGTWEAASHIPTEPNIYRFATNRQMFAAFNVERDWPEDEHALVAGPTSLHMTMHFAAYLGAKSIILAGTDCGRFDDLSNFSDYAIGDNPFTVWEQTLPLVANRIRSMGINVMSLNPFVTPALEGHAFRSPSVSINC